MAHGGQFMGGMARGGMGGVGGPGGPVQPRLCNKCNAAPANPGKGWCQGCFLRLRDANIQSAQAQRAAKEEPEDGEILG